VRRRGAHFAELDRQRIGARNRKEELVVEAEKLASSTDWAATASRFRNLMAEWKAAGRAPKEADDALWERFRTAQESFFSARSAAFAGRDSEFERNLARKEELLAAAERIDPHGDIDAARTQLRDIQQRWEAIGKVPRERIKELEARLRAVEEKVRAAGNVQRRGAGSESGARVAQFRERVKQYEAQAAKARAAGDNRRASTAQAQADQWREWLAAAERAVTSR
jgi:DNA repair exonuclease SbcCD ATPase subunit